MNGGCTHDAPREFGAIPVECSLCGGPPFATLPVNRCSRCKEDSIRPPGFERGGTEWSAVVSQHVNSELHVVRSGGPSRSADPFPDVPVRLTRSEKGRRRTEKRRTRERALRALREARDTLDILSRSDNALRLRGSAEIARAETVAAWQRYVALEDEGLDWIDHKVDSISESASRIRERPTHSEVPAGALGLINHWGGSSRGTA